MAIWPTTCCKRLSLRIHGNLHKLDEKDRVAAWVYRIARNVIHDHYRMKQGMTLATDVADEDDRRNQLNASVGVWIEELIGRLPRTYQEAVRLSEIEGWSQQEVADRLGLSVSGAKSRIQRGRQMLRGVLEQCCAFQYDHRGSVIDCDPRPERTVCRECRDLELP